MTIRFLISASFILLFSVAALAQHHQHMAAPVDSSRQVITRKKPPVKKATMTMSSVLSKNLPMGVNGSGTSWQPANSPMYMHMWHGGGWNSMLHYGAFFRYGAQNLNRPQGTRGDHSFDVPNWVMMAATRNVGRNGLLMMRGMFSADLVTVGGNGYPLLFQSGETWEGKALIDHQHPHDLISELSVAYSQALSKQTDVFAYFGLPGEPALGPPAFMHRPSALNMPSAPLGHHWQDATHITFGVATLGVRYRNMKLEGSVFTGREPGEKRYDFDRPRFDSYSGRFSVNPLPSLALQASYGRIKSPEALEPDKDVERVTASALYSATSQTKEVFSAALVWGYNRNHHSGSDMSSGHSVLLEGDYQMKKYAVFSRLEWVQKDSEELAMPDDDTGVALHNIGSLTFGLSRYILKSRYMWLDLGLSATTYAMPRELEGAYGKSPLSGEIFLRVIPPRMSMKMDKKHRHHKM